MKFLKLIFILLLITLKCDPIPMIVIQSDGLPDLLSRICSDMTQWASHISYYTGEGNTNGSYYTICEKRTLLTLPCLNTHEITLADQELEVTFFNLSSDITQYPHLHPYIIYDNENKDKTFVSCLIEDMKLVIADEKINPIINQLTNEVKFIETNLKVKPKKEFIKLTKRRATKNALMEFLGLQTNARKIFDIEFKAITMQSRRDNFMILSKHNWVDTLAYENSNMNDNEPVDSEKKAISKSGLKSKGKENINSK
jgi:hypothetical protein